MREAQGVVMAGLAGARGGASVCIRRGAKEAVGLQLATLRAPKLECCPIHSDELAPAHVEDD